MTVCVFNIELKCESDVNPKWVSECIFFELYSYYYFKKLLNHSTSDNL